MITYILKIENELFYCGKTNNLDKRLLEHKNGKDKWFNFKSRINFKLIFKVNGDYEKEIKRFGVKKFYEMVMFLS